MRVKGDGVGFVLGKVVCVCVDRKCKLAKISADFRIRISNQILHMHALLVQLGTLAGNLLAESSRAWELLL